MNYYGKLDVPFVSKNWGHELWFDNNEKYCGKLLYFVKNKKCSLHYHLIKQESFVVHSGKIELWWHDDIKMIENHIKTNKKDTLYNILERVILEPGDVFRIQPGRVHQMVALETTELFEFSTQHFESDSYRLLKGD